MLAFFDSSFWKCSRMLGALPLTCWLPMAPTISILTNFARDGSSCFSASAIATSPVKIPFDSYLETTPKTMPPRNSLDLASEGWHLSLPRPETD